MALMLVGCAPTLKRTELIAASPAAEQQSAPVRFAAELSRYTGSI